MNTNTEKEELKKLDKPFVIANPIYDTVFRRMIENQRAANFFISTILEQPVEDLSILPQGFTYKLDGSKVEEKEEVPFYSFFRRDFVATVRDKDGNPHRILIEVLKSWGTKEVMHFREYYGEQYIKTDNSDGKETVQPMTAIYILVNNLAETDCPCIKVGRTYTDMLNKKEINTSSKFIETLTHNSYVIQTGRITDVHYTTNLDRLLSVFEQRYFINDDSVTRKEYPYQLDNEEMKNITDILYTIGADPKERKQIENEKEFLRIVNNIKKQDREEKEKKLKEQDKIIEEQDKLIEKKAKEIEEKAKLIEEKTKLIEKKAKLIEEQDKENAEWKEKYATLARLLQDKQS
jgi:hypothetical protein